MIDKSEGENYYPFLFGMLTGKPDLMQSLTFNAPMPLMANMDGEMQPAGEAPAEQKSVLILSIKHPIMKYDEECGPSGTETIKQYLTEAFASDQVAAVILDMDSPGGSADAVEGLNAVIAQRNKPVLVHVDGGCNSAAYWIASACDEIHSSKRLNSIGSIGGYSTVVDMYGYYEAQGVKIEDVYAKQSTDKNKAYREWVAGDRKLIEERTSEWTQIFIDDVVKNRGLDPKSEVLKGGSYMTEDALSFNLIDGVLTLASLIERAFELAKDYEAPTNEKNTAMGLFGNNKKDIVSFAALAVLAATKPEDRTEEMVDAANTELKAAGIDGVIVDATTVQSLKDDAVRLENEANEIKESFEIVKEASNVAKSELEAANTIIDGVSALFGEDKDAEDFNLVDAVTGLKAKHDEYAGMSFPGQEPQKKGADIVDEEAAEKIELTAQEKADQEQLKHLG